jgi:glycosyltransferase involved in cell wall biosynthesis
VHILLIHQSFVSLNEAGGTRHYEMARMLAEKGHRVTVITSSVSYLSGEMRGEGNRWKITRVLAPGVTEIQAFTIQALHRSFVHRVLSYVSFMFSSFWIGLSVRNVDVVWGSSPPIFQVVTAWLISRLKRVPLLFEVRDLWPEFAIAVGVLKNRWLISASRWLERFLYHRADHVMVNSPGYIRHVQERGARKVTLIPNGADPDMFDPAADGTEFRKKYGLEGKFIVLYAGAHGMSNDLGTALQAAKLLEDNDVIQFVFVGDGKEKGNLLRQAKEMDLSNVLFLKPVAKEEIGEPMAAADCCLAILKPIDLYKTTYPNKVFDSMAEGKAVILAIDGVIRQVVEEAGAGIFVPPGNPAALAKTVLEMEKNRSNTRAMGLAGRQFVVEKFNRQKFTQDFIRLLEGMQNTDSSLQ